MASDLKYQPGLDGLRGLAAVSVLLYHVGTPGFAGGGRGVDVFFVLSGYLITGLLRAEVQDTGAINARRFWVRRMRRLYPALFAMVAAYVLLAPLLYAPQFAAMRWWDGFIALAYATNFAQALAHREFPLGHCWSLAVEMQFYLLWPLAVMLIERVRWKAELLFGLWIAATILRCAFVHGENTDFPYALLHFSGLLLGAALVYMPRLPPIRWGWIGLGLLVVFSILDDPVVHMPISTWRLSLAEVASVMLLPALLQPSPLQRAFSHPWMVYLGKISYSLYLWHFPIHHALRDAPKPIHILGTLLGGLLCAHLSYQLIERRRPRKPSAEELTLHGHAPALRVSGDG